MTVGSVEFSDEMVDQISLGHSGGSFMEEVKAKLEKVNINKKVELNSPLKRAMPATADLFELSH
jgi:hypothetical protein